MGSLNRRDFLKVSALSSGGMALNPNFINQQGSQKANKTAVNTGTKKFNIGLFGIGLDTYWPQFEGLLDKLKSYQQQIHQKMKSYGANVKDAGMVDTVEKAREAADYFKNEDVSIIFLYISTYALSSTVLPVVQKAKVPVIILNLQPTKAINYTSFNQMNDRGKMTGEWLANCQACSVPEIACVFNRAGVRFHQITGTLDDQESWQEIKDWIDAAQVAETMRNNRMGMLGHYYCGMLDVYSDLTQQSVFFGNHVEIIEMVELKAIRDKVTSQEIDAKTKQIMNHFDVEKGCSKTFIKHAAHTAVALDKLVEQKKLGSMAYYFEGTQDPEYLEIIASVIPGNSILTANHIPVAGEMEIKNVQAMKIMDAFGAGGSFTEFYAMDFNEDIVLMGHDGPGHIAIAEGRPILRPLGIYHGKPGKGLSVEMKVKQGPITVLAVVQTFEGKLKFLVAEGISVEGPILEIGNTNSRYKFPVSVKEYINAWSSEGPSHHCAIGIGHIADKIEKLGAIFNMEVTKIC